MFKKSVLILSFILITILVGCKQTKTPIYDLSKSLANTKWESTYGDVYCFNEDGTEMIFANDRFITYKIYAGRYRQVSYSKDGLIFNLDTEIEITVEDDVMTITETWEDNKTEHIFNRIVEE